MVQITLDTVIRDAAHLRTAVAKLLLLLKHGQALLEVCWLPLTICRS